MNNIHSENKMAPKPLVLEMWDIVSIHRFQNARILSNVALQYHARVGSKKEHAKLYIRRACLNVDNVSVGSQDGL